MYCVVVGIDYITLFLRCYLLSLFCPPFTLPSSQRCLRKQGPIGWCEPDDDCDYCERHAVESEQIVSSSTVDDDTPPSEDEKPKEVLTTQEATQMINIEPTPEIPRLLMTCEAHPDGNCPVIHQFIPPFRLDS
jgi:hypothetical protein